MFEPNPEQIKAECEAIKVNWSDKIRKKRANNVNKRWLVPIIDLNDINVDEYEDNYADKSIT